MAGHFDEALVEAQVVADGILPALFVVAVVGKVLHDELVDAVESQPLFGTAPDGHHDEGVVREWRLLHFLLLVAAALLGIIGLSVLFAVVAGAALRLAGRVVASRRLGRAVEVIFALLFALDGTGHTFHVEIFVRVHVVITVITVQVLLHQR